MSSGVVIFGGLLFFVGLILAAIGIVLLINQSQPRQWWMWGLLIGGVVFLVIGAGVWLYNRESYEDPLIVDSQYYQSEDKWTNLPPMITS